MGSKQAIGLGAICGLAVGALGCMGVLLWTGGQMKEAQSEAYEQGVQYGFAKAQKERSLVGDEFNTMVLNENERLTEAFTKVRETLGQLDGRADLPEDVQTTVAELIKELPE
jgi:flagellar biosynthesis/type III secretory pathway protein FliH